MSISIIPNGALPQEQLMVNAYNIKNGTNLLHGDIVNKIVEMKYGTNSPLFFKTVSQD
ncbi:MAG: hypothetical protein RSB95_04890 [Bacilli bacterium]